jgi:hypothetical protein
VRPRGLPEDPEHADGTNDSRLFEFNIPRIDIFASPYGIHVLVRSAVTSLSSDKIEEISVFNEVWADPLVKTSRASDRAAPVRGECLSPNRVLHALLPVRGRARDRPGSPQSRTRRLLLPASFRQNS